MKKVILSITLIATMIAMNHVQDVSAINEQPSTTIIVGDDGFVDIKLEELTPAVQVSVNAFLLDYDLEALKFNAEKQLTKVKLIKKDDQSAKTVYLDVEGKEVQKDPAMLKEKARTEEQKPSAEISYGMQDDGFVTIKFEELNENVQAAVRVIADKYDVTALTYNGEKKITKVIGTGKEDKSEKIFYLNDKGEEVNMDVAPAEKAETEVPMVV